MTTPIKRFSVTDLYTIISLPKIILETPWKFEMNHESCPSHTITIEFMGMAWAWVCLERNVASIRAFLRSAFIGFYICVYKGMLLRDKAFSQLLFPVYIIISL